MAHNCFCYLIWSVTFNLNMMNLKKNLKKHPPPKKNPPKKQNQKNLQKTKKKIVPASS